MGCILRGRDAKQRPVPGRASAVDLPLPTGVFHWLGARGCQRRGGPRTGILLERRQRLGDHAPECSQFLPGKVPKREAFDPVDLDVASPEQTRPSRGQADVQDAAMARRFAACDQRLRFECGNDFVHGLRGDLESASQVRGRRPVAVSRQAGVLVFPSPEGLAIKSPTALHLGPQQPPRDSLRILTGPEPAAIGLGDGQRSCCANNLI
jgi:hypothetical protein